MATNSTIKRASPDTVADRAATVARDCRDIGDAAKQMAADSVAAVRDTAYQYFDEGRSHVRHLSTGVQSQIQERPLKAILIAAGVGFLLGAIWTRR